MSEHIYASKKNLNLFDLWQDRPPLLSQLDIELTERCNNNCLHCCIRRPADCPNAKKSELPLSDIKEIFTQAADLGALYVRITGGEPLLREDFDEIYITARKLGLRVMLLTNACLLTPATAELLSRVPPLIEIEVTAYGMTEMSYEAVTRQKGSYACFKKGISILRQNNIPFVVKGVLLPSTRHEIDQLEEWAATIPWMKKPPSLAMLFNLRDRRDSSCINKQIEKLRLTPQDYLSVLNRRRADYLKDMVQFCSKFMGPQGDQLFPCGAGHKLCVDAYGTVQPCLPLRHPDTVWSFKNGSLHDALRFFSANLGKMKATDVEYLETCAKCFLKGLCEQCPAKSWSEHGTLDRPVEYFCGIAHALAQDIGLLYNGEKGWEVKEWKERVARLKQ